jgi:flagellar biosynthetic protein FliR
MTIPIPELSAAFLLTFARVGTMVMLMPGVGEAMISARLRLAFALLLSLVLFPFTRTILPSLAAPTAGIGLLIGEIAVGLAIGVSVRMILAALQTAGTVIAQQIGLAFATTVDPTMGGQQASIANLLTLLGVTLILTTDLHHLAIGGIKQSYALLPPTGIPDTGDAASLAVRAAARGFSLAVQISAPFIAFGILFNVGAGLLARLMPQLQVFFLVMPAGILAGMAVLLAVLGVVMTVFLGNLGDFLSGLGSR